MNRNNNQLKNTTLPNIIDIEASGFGANSYPIEIGVVRHDGERFCKLIRPFIDWQHWHKDAAAIHKISRHQLETFGLPGTEVCLQLNAFLKTDTVYSDAWQVDSTWLNTLYDRAQVSRSFSMSSLEMLMSEAQISIWDETKDVVVKSLDLGRHRASNDALIIQNTFQQSRSGSKAPQ